MPWVQENIPGVVMLFLFRVISEQLVLTGLSVGVTSGFQKCLQYLRSSVLTTKIYFSVQIDERHKSFCKEGVNICFLCSKGHLKQISDDFFMFNFLFFVLRK